MYSTLFEVSFDVKYCVPWERVLNGHLELRRNLSIPRGSALISTSFTVFVCSFAEQRYVHVRLLWFKFTLGIGIFLSSGV